MTKPRKPKRKTANGSPAVLPKRPEQKHTRYSRVGNFAGTLDSVALSISTTATKDNEYTLPDMEGDIYRTLRQYGLVMARYQIVDKHKFAKRYKHSIKTIDTACRVVANFLFRSIYEADPTDGTVHLAPLLSAAQAPILGDDVMMAIACYMGTDAFTPLMESVKDPDALDVLLDINGHMRNALEDTSPDEAGNFTMAYHLRRIMTYINHPDKREQRDALRSYKLICDYLQLISPRVARRRHERQSEIERKANEAKAAKEAQDKARREREGRPAKGRVIESSVDSGWELAVLAKPELTVSHTGLIGRRIRASKEGKYVRDLGRIISDPEQRVFGRKTRALGGVVVVDCSGSMSLTDEEMKAIMRSSAGCTVVAYSSGGNDAKGEPNIWLVARRGRQVRDLPSFPGGNGVDGPALEYGLSFRTHNAPVVWISDTQVTGASGYNQAKLRAQCLRLCRLNNIYIAPNCEQAVELLKKLQSGQRVNYTPLEENKNDLR